MIRKQSYRYYCEFCKKSGGSGGAMANHEKHCTMNPDRKCRICFHLIDEPSITFNKLLDSVTPVPPKEEQEQWINNLIDLRGGCPMCVFSALRQRGLLGYAYNENGIPTQEPVIFDIKKKMEEFWATINEEEYKRDMQSLLYQ